MGLFLSTYEYWEGVDREGGHFKEAEEQGTEEGRGVLESRCKAVHGQADGLKDGKLFITDKA